MRLRAAALAVLAGLALASPRAAAAKAPLRAARQEDALAIVRVRVTAVAGGSVYLDRGRADGLEPGDAVRLLPPGAPVALAVVRSVATDSARAELRGPATGVDIGTEGEVRIPAGRLEPPEPSPVPSSDEPAPPSEPETVPPETEVPEHPPWEHPPEAWAEDVPLLAPVAAREPEERERRVRGRLHTRAEYTRDDGDEDVDHAYASSVSGLELAFENPFHRAGELLLDLDYYHRSADLEAAEDSSESVLRPQRLSYRRGGIRGEPLRWEVGRFLQQEFPELGIVDGAEIGYRLPSGSRVGASVGLFPEPNDELKSGDDVQASVFYRFVRGEREDLALGLAYQKTWHEGEADRDLLVSSLRYRPARRAFVSATAWIDYYGSDAVLKDSGFELTQLQLNARHDWDRAGLGVFATHLRFPELLRAEFPSVAAEELADSSLQRIGLSAWTRVTERTRLDARGDVWEDEEDSGGNAEMGFVLRDVLYERGDVGFAVYANQGQFSDAVGGRVRATRRLDHGYLSVVYDVTNFEQQDFVGSQEEILHHSAIASYDVRLGRGWDLSLYVQDRLRDDLNSFTAGVGLQKTL